MRSELHDWQSWGTPLGTPQATPHLTIQNPITLNSGAEFDVFGEGIFQGAKPEFSKLQSHRNSATFSASLSLDSKLASAGWANLLRLG